MSVALIANRYARAFVDAVGQKDSSEIQEFYAFCDLVDKNPQLGLVLANVTVATEHKLALVKALAKRLKMADRVTRFLAVLIHNGRIDLLNAVGVSVAKRLDEISGVQPLELTVAAPPSKARMTAFTKKFEERLGVKIRVSVTTDPSLMAGAVAKVGSTVFDGSLRGRLQRLGKELVKENA